MAIKSWRIHNIFLGVFLAWAYRGFVSIRHPVGSVPLGNTHRHILWADLLPSRELQFLFVLFAQANSEQGVVSFELEKTSLSPQIRGLLCFSGICGLPGRLVLDEFGVLCCPHTGDLRPHP